MKIPSILGLALFALLFADVTDALAQQRGRNRQRDRGRDGGQNAGLQVGQEAPTFVLKSLDGESETDLASFRGQKPVVLFFGSYT